MDHRKGLIGAAREDHPIESAPPEVRKVIEAVLQREHDMCHTRKGVTPDDIVMIIKAIIQ